MPNHTEEHYQDLLRRAAGKINELMAQVDRLGRRDPVAVIGCGCRLPGGVTGLDQLGRALAEGRDAVGPIPADRARAFARMEDALAREPLYAPRGGFLDDVEHFDPALFNMTPAEAAKVDPQQRLLLETSWEALENAGIDPKSLRGSNTGVFVGQSTFDFSYSAFWNERAERFTQHSVTGVAFSVSAGRLSYFFDLHGPAMTVDTACSSSLATALLAMRSLQARECDLALAGGMAVLLRPEAFLGFAKLGILSPDGMCKAFGRDANGIARGEGGGMLALRRLDDALARKDPILAVLRGGAMNHDGRSNGLTAPNGPSQREVIARALEDAGLTPDDIQVVETHGTGTELGDAIELGALAQAYAKRDPGLARAYIGSIKSNIGHLEAAAGFAGLAKVLAQMDRGQVFPTLHCRPPNAKFDWDSAPLALPTVAVDWDGGGRPRAAGVSSFSFSGTNVHLVLTEPPAPREDAEEPPPQAGWRPLTLSARAPESLVQLALAHAERLDALPDADLPAFLHTANTGRAAFRRRAACVGASRADLAERLRGLAQGRSHPDAFQGEAASEPPAPAFLFSGQGGFTPGMGRELYEGQPVFRAVMDECSETVRDRMGLDLAGALYGPDRRLADGLAGTVLLHQAGTFAVQCGLAALLESWGVLPSAVAGHSLGEYAAAAACGALTRQAALSLMLARIQCILDHADQGSMVTVFADRATVDGLLPGREGLVVAASNAPACHTVSGPSRAVEELGRELERRSIASRPLDTTHAFHSPLMHGAADRLAVRAAGLQPGKAKAAYYSSARGERVESGLLADPAYWASQMKGEVRFAQAFNALCRDGHRLFVELGPGSGLLSLGRQCLDQDGVFLPTLSGRKGDRNTLLRCAARLWTLGAAVDWRAVAGGRDPRRLRLPTYPFQRVRVPMPETEPATAPTPTPIATETTPLQDTTPTRLSDQAVLDHLTTFISEATGIRPSDLDASAHFLELGLDSLMLVRLLNEAKERYGCELSLAQAFREINSLSSLAAWVAAHGSARPAQPAQPAHSPQAPQAPAHMPAMPAMPAGQAASGPMAEALQLMHRQLEVLEKFAQSGGGTAQAQAQAPRPRRAGASLQAGISIRGMSLADERTYTDEQRAFMDRTVRELNALTPGSKSMTQDSRAYFADWKHTLQFRATLKDAMYPVVAKAMSGPRFTDVDGNEFLDIAMGMGVHLLGHNPDVVRRALDERLQAGFGLGPQSHLAGEVAALVRRLTGVERVAFSNTGSEAVMVALRVARAATGKSKVVIFSGSYHGISDGVLGMQIGGETVPLSPGLPPGMVEEVVNLDFGAPAALKAIAEQADELAAVLVEPVQSRKPGLQPQWFLKALRRLTAEKGLVLIFDEMITGFRIHPGGAQAWYGIQADIVTYGKALGGGLPISVIAGKAKYLDYIDGGFWQYGDDSAPSGNMVSFGGTYCRHPLALAAARAALTHMLEQGPALQEEANRKTAHLVDSLNHFFQAEEFPVRVERFGSLFRFLTELQPIELDLFFLRLLLRGVYTWEQKICFLSEAHTDQDVERILEAAKRSARDVREGGFPFRGVTLPRRFHATGSIEQRIYALSQRPGGNLSYQLPGCVIITGPLDEDRLEQALCRVVERHDGLRSSYRLFDGELLRMVEPYARLDVARMELDEKDLDDALRAFIQPMDLARAPLARFAVVRLGPERHALFLSYHHIAVDGRSVDVLMRETLALYHGEELPLVQTQYGEAQEMAKKRLEERRGELAAFWRKALEPGEEGLPVLDLPTDFPRPAARTLSGRTERFFLDREAAIRLRKAAAGCKATTFMLLTAAVSGWLHRLTGRRDILLGVPVLGRGAAGADDAVGMFVDTMVIRTRPAPDLAFADHLAATAGACADAYAHQDYPFADLLADLDIEVPADRNPLFDVMVGYEATDRAHLHSGELSVVNRVVPHTAALFDMTLEFYDGPDGIEAMLHYQDQLFRRETAAHWLRSFRMFLEHAAREPRTTLSELAVLGDKDLARILGEFNPPALEPARGTILERILAHEASDAPALVQGGLRLSYAETFSLARRLAGRLRDLGVGPETTVAVCMGQTVESVWAFLGVLLAGAAYVPLDPEAPTLRLESIMDQSRPACLVTKGTLAHSLPADCPVVLAEDLEDAPEARDLPLPEPDHLAYVIFTSGSTGAPKGVAVTHANLLASTEARYGWYGEKPTGYFMAAPLFFDSSVAGIYWTLASGGALVFAAPAKPSPLDMLRAIEAEKVSHAMFLPRLYRLVLECVDKGQWASLKTIIVGAEALASDLVREHCRRFPRIRLTNEYGPTEATVWATAWDADPDELAGPTAPIGRPIPGYRCHVLDSASRPVPVGAVGELYIGGPGVARGYVNNPEATAERFVPDPFAAGPDARLYRTGDMARHRPDGAIEFLGRMDGQVKVRGFRIELGEIEAVLLGHEAVADAGVAAVSNGGNNGDTTLAAFVVPQRKWSPTADELRDYLGQRLPRAMIPADIELRDSLPRTASGKLDRKALRPHTAGPRRVEYQAPSSRAEHLLARAWTDVLGVDAPGMLDNYFHLGGDSIKAIQVAGHIQRAGFHIGVADVLQYPVLGEQALRLTGSAPRRRGRAAVGEYPLTPIQRWFLDARAPGLAQDSLNLALRGKERLDPDALAVALEALARHHDSLRTRFPEPLPTQGRAEVMEPSGRIDLTVEDLRDRDEDEAGKALDLAADDLRSGLDPAEGRVFRCLLARLPGHDLLLLSIHHLVADAVSLRILMEDLERAYHDASRSKAPDLGDKTTSFREWAEETSRWAMAPGREDEARYWRGVLEAPADPLPVDGPPRRARAGERRGAPVSLDAEATARLMESGRNGPGAHALLLSALGRALARWHGGRATRIWLEGHGREPWTEHLDATRTVGWFTSLFPFLLHGGEADPKTRAKAVRRALDEVPGKGRGFAPLAWIAGRVPPPSLDSPEFTFNYLGDFDESTDMGFFHLADYAPDKDLGPDAGTPCGFELNLFKMNRRLHGLLWHDPAVHDPDNADRLAALLQEELAALASPEVRPEQRETPLTPLQQGILFHVLAEPDNEIYRCGFRFQLRGEFDPDILRRVLDLLAERHPILRAAVRTRRDPPALAVLPDRDIPLESLDLSACPGAEREAEQARFRTRLRRPFDLENEPLLRIGLLKLGEALHEFHWVGHHIALDGWSAVLVLQELFTTYDALTRGAPPALPPAPSFADYVRTLAALPKEPAEAYWKQTLEGSRRGPFLVRPAQGFDPARHSFHLGSERTERLAALAREAGATMASLVNALWGLLLCRVSGGSEAVFGAVVSGRHLNLEGIERLVGMCINTVPVRFRVPATASFTDLVRDVGRSFTAGLAHQHTHLPLIQAMAGQGGPLFDHIVSMENYPLDDTMDMLPGLDISDAVSMEQAHYDLSLEVMPGPDLGLCLIYNRRCFRPDWPGRVQRLLTSLADQALAAPGAPVSELPGLDPGDLAGVEAFFPDQAAPAPAGDAEPPGTDTEKRLAALWRETLKVDHVGRGDSFFDLGGHSLLLMQLVVRLHREWGLELSLEDALREPTLAAMAALLDNNGRADEVPDAAETPLSAEELALLRSDLQ